LTPNPYETHAETAQRLGLDPNGPIGGELGIAFLQEREKINAARRELEATLPPPPPPPPDHPADLLAQTRQRAATLREERSLAQDLREVLLADNKDGLTEEEVNAMPLAELRQMAGIDPTPAQIEADLANDYRTNVAAADASEAVSYGSEEWRANLAAQIEATDSKMGDDS
jgi:hypothetical protein